jgi:hypothetical protein
MCKHVSAADPEPLDIVRWYSGHGLQSELLCSACSIEREQGEPFAPTWLCEACYNEQLSEFNPPMRVRGQPEVLKRSEPMASELTRDTLPKALGAVIDFAPIVEGAHSVWLLLAEDGTLAQFDAATGRYDDLIASKLAREADRKPWRRALKRRLHASQDGAFAAVVNDYGRYGEVLDLRAARVTMQLDGGDYYCNTVPFSIAFAKRDGRTVIIHRIDWNRLQMSDPATGESLAAGDSAQGLQAPAPASRGLDYFHGALHISPSCERIAYDGWQWHPVGVPTTGSLEHFVRDNSHEPENRASMVDLCVTEYYWDRAMVWLDNQRIAIEGIGDDQNEILAGARIFDTTQRSPSGPRAKEIKAFAGPSGAFFSDGRWLYAANDAGLTRWDPSTGEQTGQLDGFVPTRWHPGARELAQIVGGEIVRWAVQGG